MDNKILKLEDKIQEQNRLIRVLTRQNKEKDREIKYLKTQISDQNISKARDLEENGAVLKTRIQKDCLLYTSPSPRDRQKSRMPSSA